MLSLAAAIAGLIFFNSSDDDRESRQAWERYRRELEAGGESLDWEDFIPATVPDDQNLYLAPGMPARFSRHESQTNPLPVFSLPTWVTNPPLTLDQLRAMPEGTDDGRDSSTAPVNSRQRLRDWFERNEVEYRRLVEACARPATRFDAVYTNANPVDLDVPSFVNLRIVPQALVSHAGLSLLDEEPDVAVQDLNMLKRMGDLAGSSPTIVGTMMQVAILGLYVETARDALELDALSDNHLEAMQNQIRDVDLLETFANSFRAERANEMRWLTLPPDDLVKALSPFFGGPSLKSKPVWKFSGTDWANWHRGLKWRRHLRSRRWVFENFTTLCRFHQEMLDPLDVTNHRLHAAASSLAFSNISQTLSAPRPNHQLAAVTFPNFSRAMLTMARVQTLLDQLFVACALERYHLAYGHYPDSLDDLRPEYIDYIPNDLFADQPLQYRRDEDGSYELWSVGWDEKDDGEKVNLNGNNAPLYNDTPGDWVWSWPAP